LSEEIARRERSHRWPSAKPWPSASGNGWPGVKGWVLVEPEGVENDEQLEDWIERATTFVRTLPAKEK
jgi:hypothetical protein